MNNKQTLVFIFFAAAYTLATLAGSYPLNWLLKLVPMIMLIVISFQLQKSKAEKLFLIGLVFSAGGDFFLTFGPATWFIFGLGSFLIAHLFYIFSLLPIENKKLPYLIPYVAFGAVMFNFIEQGLGELWVPVFVYMSILLIMSIFTLVSQKSNFWLILGGLSFAASDTLLGINKFHSAIPFASVLIMATYYFAQYSLVKGMFLSQAKESS